MSEKRVTVWVQRFNDRRHLILQWSDPVTGKRRSRSAGTADERKAEQARADLEYELNNGLHAEPSKLTWEKFREVFEAEYLSGRRANTRNNYRNTFRLFEEVCRPTTLRSVNERTLSAFVAGLRRRPVRGGGEGMMPSTIKVNLQFLHSALAWAAGQKLIPSVPRFPSVKVPQKKPQPVAAELFDRLLDKAGDAQTRAFFLCGWLAGLRRGEALALEWSETHDQPWLDFERDRIVLPAEFVKGDADQWVPLDPALAEALAALPRHGAKVFRFVNAAGGPISAGTVSTKVTKLARAAGVKLSMKTLRKGFGSRYAARVPAQVLQKLMRHSDIKTTMDFYANVDEAVMTAVLGPKRNAKRNTTPAGQRAGVS